MRARAVFRSAFSDLRSRRPTRHAATFCCVVLAVAVAVQAQQVSDREQARRHYEAGAAAYEAADYASALVELQRSYELFASLRTLYSIARCQQAVFDYPAAVRSLEKYLREGGDEIPLATRQEAETALAQMQRDMAHLQVTVNVDGAQIVVDGLHRGASPAAEPIDVGPGIHSVEIRRDGFVAFVQRVSVAAGQTETLVGTLEAEAGLASALRVETGGVAARVFVDGVDAGTTPVEVPAEPGEHEVRVEAGGYDPVVRRVSVGAGRTVDLAVELVRVAAAAPPIGPETPPVGPPPTQDPAGANDSGVHSAEDDEGGSLWWVWALIGVAVAGGAVAAGVVLGMPEDLAYDGTWRTR